MTSKKGKKFISFKISDLVKYDLNQVKTHYSQLIKKSSPKVNEK